MDTTLIVGKARFQQEEIEKLKRQLVENTKQAEENAKQINEIPKLRRQLEELRNLLKNNKLQNKTTKARK